MADEVLALQVRDRGIGGRDKPLTADQTTLHHGETVAFNLAMGHTLATGITLSSATANVKTGTGITVDGLAVASPVVTGRITIGSTAPSDNLVAIRIVLSNADTWEVNVPIWVDEA